MTGNSYVSCPDCERDSVAADKMVKGVCPECHNPYNPDWLEYAQYERTGIPPRKS